MAREKAEISAIQLKACDWGSDTQTKYSKLL